MIDVRDESGALLGVFDWPAAALDGTSVRYPVDALDGTFNEGELRVRRFVVGGAIMRGLLATASDLAWLEKLEDFKRA